VRESSATGSLSDWMYRGTTFIDGGNIYANTIHTDHIKSLSADKITFDGHVFGENATFTGDIESSSYTAIGEIETIDDLLIYDSETSFDYTGFYNSLSLLEEGFGSFAELKHGQ